MAAGLFIGASDLQAQCSGSGAKKANASCCASKKNDAKITEAKVVTKDEVAELVNATNVTIIDARDEESYAAGHIDGAVNFVKAELPADKNAKLIFYCGGEKCPAASKAARKAMENGYKNVMVFRGGWAEWNKQS
jgi:rhodanese-related sulfurtransferase